MRQKGFTLIELLVVISIIGLLAAVVLVALNNSRQKSRDTRRLLDVKQIQTALELYLSNNGQYPPPSDGDCSGWDTSNDSVFIQELKAAKLTGDIKDPSYGNLCGGGYYYYRYPAGNAGCDSARGAFYVLAIIDMETSSRPHPNSPGWSCPSRNWQNEFDWVTGKFSS